MRLRTLLVPVSIVLAAVAVGGCVAGPAGPGPGGGATAGTQLVEHSDPVPAGMPVMYEFFTQT